MTKLQWNHLVGKVIEGQFHLVEFLGAGGFGGVFKADNIVGGRVMRTLAVKLIAPPVAGTPEQVDALVDLQLNELQLNAQLEHQNIVRCYSLGETVIDGQSLLYIALELGQTSLLKQLEKGPMAPIEIQELCVHIATALTYLHGSRGGLVHRDIKPGNVLRVGDHWKLTDMGTALEMEGERLAVDAALGTADYAPPEAYDGIVTPAWDIWSVGVVLVEAYCGTVPFSAKTPHALMNNVRNDPPFIPSELPAPFKAIVNGCLRKSHKDRISATAILEMLGEARPQPAVPSIDTVVSQPATIVPEPSDQEPDTPDKVVAEEPVSREKLDKLREAIQIALSDRRIDRWERTDLNRLRKELGIKLEDAAAMFREEKSNVGDLELEQPLMPRQKADIGDLAGGLAGKWNPERISDEIRPVEQPSSYVVDLNIARPADFRTISEAVNEAKPGMRILVRPGVYRESLVLDKPLSIEGSGERADVILESTDAHTIHVASEGCSLMRLSLRCEVSRDGTAFSTIFIGGGSVNVKRCDIVSAAEACLVVRGAGNSMAVSDCSVYGARRIGISVSHQAQAEISNTNIHNTGLAGLFSSEGAQIFADSLRLHNNQYYGVLIDDNGLCRVTKCRIDGNGEAGIMIESGGNAYFKECAINGNRCFGVIIQGRAVGRFEGCDVTGNAYGAWNVDEQGVYTGSNNTE